MSDSFNCFTMQLIKQKICDGNINDKGQIYDPNDIRQIGFLLGCEVVEDMAKNSEKLKAFFHDLERVAFCRFLPCEDAVYIDLCDKNRETIFASGFSRDILEVVDFETSANKAAITEGYMQGIAFFSLQY